MACRASWLLFAVVLPAAGATGHMGAIDLGDAGTWIVSVTEPERLVLRPTGGADGPVAEIQVPGLPSGATPARADSVEGPGGRRVARVVLAAADGGEFEVLLHAAGRPAVPAAIWAGPTGLRGDPGERIGAQVLIEDIDRDGHPDVVIGRLAEGIRVCGRDEPALLHRRAYDWSSGVLRPVSGPRPGLSAAAAVPLGRSDGPPEGVVLLPLLEYASASSSHGDGGDPMRGAPPRGLEDMDQRTGWAEGAGGPGRYEFVTARIVTDRAPARWLAVRSTDGSTADAARTRNRPAALLLVDGSGRAWRVDPPDDAAARSGAVAWYALPFPFPGGCATAALLDAHPATSPDGRRASVTWISDLQAFAAIDPVADAAAIRAILDDGASAAAAERLLAAFGDAAVPLVAGMARSLGAIGAARAASLLAARHEPIAVEALASLLLSRDERTTSAVREAVAGRGEAASGALAALLDRPEPDVARLALELLADAGGPDALAAIVARAGRGDDADRSAFRRAIAAFLGRRPDAMTAVADAAAAVASEGRSDAAIELLRALPLGRPAVGGRVAGLVAERLGSAESFEDRYHLLRLAAELGADAGRATAPAALDLALRAAEPEIRAEAAATLGVVAPPDIDLSPLLDDPWPGVREAAARAIGRRRLDREVRALAARYAVETWPRVRAAAAEGLLGGEWPGDDVVGLLLADPSELVRGRAVGALDARGDEASIAALAAVARSSSERPAIRRAAVSAAARRCWSGLKPMLVGIIEASVRAGATPDDQALALEAIELLGSAGPPGARALLEEIVREAPVAPMPAAALAALGALGDRAAAPAVEEFRGHRDPGIRDAAIRALRALERPRRRPPRCAGE